MEATKFEGIYYELNRFKEKTFIARFKINKKTYKRVVGKAPQDNAKTAYLKKLELIRELTTGIISINLTIDKLFEQYLQSREHELSDSWYNGLNRAYTKHLSSIVGEKKPHEVSFHIVQEKMNDMLLEVGNSHKKSNRKYAESTVKQLKDCISGLYSWLIEYKDYKDENIGKKLKVPKFDNKIYFVISHEQATAIFREIINYTHPLWKAYFIWLLHGRRKMEVALSEWEELNLELMQYIIPANKVKNKQPIIAPILPILKEALLNISDNGRGYIFKGAKGAEHVSAAGIDYHWRVIRANAGVPKMRLHDIRHMLGFFAINSDFNLEQIGKVLNQKSLNATKRYANVAVSSSYNIVKKMFDVYGE